MGDRAQLCITNGTEAFYLYTHWNGAELPNILAEGLQRAAKEGRTLKDDPSYALGIVMRELVRAHGIDTSTGLGVGNVLGDNDGDSRVLVLNWAAATVQDRPLEEFLAEPNW